MARSPRSTSTGLDLIASDTTNSYSATWTKRPPDVSADGRATDSDGVTTTSSPVSVTVNSPTNQAPTVSLTGPRRARPSPRRRALRSAPRPATRTARSPGGLLSGSTLLGSDTTSPYGYTWTSVARVVSADGVARDNGGATRTSAAVSVTVNSATNQAPSVALSSPASGASFTAPANITRERDGVRHGRHGRARRVLPRIDAHRIGYDQPVLGGLERRDGGHLLADGARRRQRRGDAHVDGRQHHRHGGGQSAADGVDHQPDRRPVVHGAGVADDRGRGERHRRDDHWRRLLRRHAARRRPIRRVPTPRRGRTSPPAATR